MNQSPIALKATEQRLAVKVIVEKGYIYTRTCFYVHRWRKACLLRREAFPRPWPNPVDEEVKGRGTHVFLTVAGLSNPGRCGTLAGPSVG